MLCPWYHYPVSGNHVGINGTYKVGSARVPLKRGGGAALKLFEWCHQPYQKDRYSLIEQSKHSNRRVKYFYEPIKYFLWNAALEFNAGICIPCI